MPPIGNFQTDLVVRATEDGATWELSDPLIYEGCRESFTVPRGFRTDFASTPRCLWWWLPPFGRYLGAAVLHDWLYTGRVSRQDADRIFFRVMVEGRTRLIRAWLMYVAVRVFGSRAYNGRQS